MEYAYKLNLYDEYHTEISVTTFDTIGELEKYIDTIFRHGAEKDCTYKLTDWLGISTEKGFTTKEDFMSEWVSDFYYQEEEILKNGQGKEKQDDNY